MKKFIFILFSLLILLAACGQDTTKDVNEDGNNGMEEIQEEQQISEPEEVDTEGVEIVAEDLAIIHLYFSDEELMNIYQVDVSMRQSNNVEENIANALNNWIQGPNIEGLAAVVPPDVKIQSIEISDEVVYLSFSDEILQANLGSTGENYLIQQLVMIVEQFGYEKIFILINGQEQETLLGHVEINEPISREIPADQIERFQE